MVLKTELCRFSGKRVYPGHGMRYYRTDSTTYLFADAKCKRLFNNRLKPSKLAWTAIYRKQHKKDQAMQATRKKRRAKTSNMTRGFVGASLEVIQKRRQEKPEVRKAARDAALAEIKARMKGKKGGKK
uniref:Large ribosomal subunit protein eL24-related N-terminal domain-containing protein n=1 Tax=Prasinoderma coloniale TaxID=156133 RepID=A0A7R9TXB5_9VIRI|mmetsp:Transcript_4433/g.28258  ORF Transcript_4433/g.28258 Transcript_4433/m.28258 type:complete len:128 (-) Transcript_4433:76-459(-)|eukprot:PRCOL_00002004-RA